MKNGYFATNKTSSSSELALSVSLTLSNGMQANTLPKLLQALEELPKEVQQEAFLEPNARAHEVLQKQDALAGAFFDAGFKAGFYDEVDSRFAAIRDAKKRHITAEGKRTTILKATVSRKNSVRQYER